MRPRRSIPARALILAVAACLWSLAALPGWAEGEADAATLRRVFKAYKEALLNADGETAVRLVDRETLTYYDRVKRLALEGDSETVHAQSFIDRLLIVRPWYTVASDLHGVPLGLLSVPFGITCRLSGLTYFVGATGEKR